MTVICRKLGLLFIQTPHAASTAIGQLLRSDYGGERLQTPEMFEDRGADTLRRKHHTLEWLLDAHLVTPDERRRLVVVAGVRNPFDVVFTEFARTGAQGRSVRLWRLVRRALGRRADQRADFERFVERRYAPGRLLRLIGRRPRVAEDWAAGADHVIRFERLQHDFDAAMRRVGAEPKEIPRANVTERRRGRDYREMYTPQARSIVETAYAEQLRRYGYDFEAGAREAIESPADADRLDAAARDRVARERAARS